MACIRKHKGKWQVQIERKGVRTSRSFATKGEASAWAALQEAEILHESRAKYPTKTLADAIQRYLEDISPTKRGARFEKLRFGALIRDFPWLAGKLIYEVETPDLVRWRDARLKVVTSGSVLRDCNLLRNLFSVARDEWKWLGESPFKGFKVPTENPPRERRVFPSEVKAICRWLGYRNGAVVTVQQETALAFLIGLRTGMRASEILSLSKATVDLAKRVARVPHKTQHLTGKMREIPLTRAAARLLRPQMGRDKVFSMSDRSLDKTFRRATSALGIVDLHFHDSRAEALTRLSRRVDVLTLAKISGHKDVNLLSNTYYRESAADIAARLG